MSTVEAGDSTARPGGTFYGAQMDGYRLCAVLGCAGSPPVRKHEVLFGEFA